MKNYLSVLLVCFFLSTCLVNFAQTETPPVYSPDGPVTTMVSKGDTLITGGLFAHIGKYTGGGALFTSASDLPDLAFPKFLDGVISACTPDGTGGFYIAGIFYRENETVNKRKQRIEHILPDNTFDPDFSLDVHTQSNLLNQLLYHNNILFIAGYGVTQIGNDSVGDISAYDISARQFLNYMPSLTFQGDRNANTGVKKMAIANNSLYFIGVFDKVKGITRNKAASFDIATGVINAWDPTPNWTDFNSYSDIVTYNDKIILAGGFDDHAFPDPERRCCAIVDNVTGSTYQYVFRSDNAPGNGYSYLSFQAGVSAIAVKDDILYTFSARSTCGDTRVTAIDLASIPANNTLWTRHFNCIAGANAVSLNIIDHDLFVLGASFDNIYTQTFLNQSDSIEMYIKGGVQLNTENGHLKNWFPNPVQIVTNDILCATTYDNKIFIGGKFSHVNGLDRKGVYITNAQTETVLPFNINAGYNNASVYSLKLINDTLYVGGALQYNAGFASVAAFNINTSDRLAWSPPDMGRVYALEADGNRLFIGGSLQEPSGGTGRVNLFALNRQTAALESWAPDPNSGVYSLKVTNGKLYVAGGFSSVAGAPRNSLASFDLNTFMLADWNPNANNNVTVLHPRDNTIWVGGYFSRVGDSTRYMLGGVNPVNGYVRPSPYFNFGGYIKAVQSKGSYLLAAGSFELNDATGWNNYMLYDLQNKVTIPGNTLFEERSSNFSSFPFEVNSLAIAGNDVFYGGNFMKVNGKAIAPYVGRIKYPADFFIAGGDYISVQNGDWDAPSTWQKNEVPPVSARVTVRHSVVVTQNASCYSLLVEKPAGDLHVNEGADLKILSSY